MKMRSRLRFAVILAVRLALMVALRAAVRLALRATRKTGWKWAGILAAH